MFNRLVFEHEPDVYDRNSDGFYDELVYGEDAGDDVADLMKMGWTKEKAQSFIKRSEAIGL